jgi:hypothetical protein
MSFPDVHAVIKLVVMHSELKDEQDQTGEDAKLS